MLNRYRALNAIPQFPPSLLRDSVQKDTGLLDVHTFQRSECSRVGIQPCAGRIHPFVPRRQFTATREPVTRPRRILLGNVCEFPHTWS